jgi:hypothetical protein
MPDTFSRDDIKAYEAKNFAPVTDPDPAPVVAADPPADEPIDADPAGDDSPDADADPSTADDDTVQPDAADDDSSADTNADPAAADASSESDTGKPAPKPAKGSAAERIQGLVSKGKEKDVTIESLMQLNKDLLEEMRAARQPAGKSPTAPAAPAAVVDASDKDDPQPTIDQFDYDPVKHGKALNDWYLKQSAKLEQRILQRVARDTASANEVAQAGAIFRERTAEFAKGIPNFEEVTKGKTLPQFDPRAARAIVVSPQGPAVHFELLQNPKEAQRIAALDPADQLLAIGELAGQAAAKAAASKKPTELVKPKKPAPKKVTGAPPPPRPNPAGTSPHVKNMLDGSMSMEDWVKADREQKIAEREARQRMRMRTR